MNPQPDPIIGNIFAFMFIATVAIYTYKAYFERQVVDIDKFIIGYIEDYRYIKKPKLEIPKPVKVKPVRNQTVKNVPTDFVTKPIEKKVKKSKVVAVETETTTTLPPALPEKPKRDEQLYNDCISSLVALGYKKTEAKNKTKQVFDKHNVSSIQDFIRLITINTIDFT
jgi:hypothetical protein